MKYIVWIFIIGFFIQSCTSDDSIDAGENITLLDLQERLFAGGETTVFSQTSFSFESPAANLSGADLQSHLRGDMDFEAIFVTAPSTVNAGLGPRFNNSSCIACHPRDGRAPFPTNIAAASGLLYRLSIGNDAQTGPIGVPNFGGQAQNQSIVGFSPEMDYTITWETVNETLADGTVVSLRKPVFGYENPYMSLPSNVQFSQRIGPPVFGLGLLEFIPENDILALQDINDNNGDQISGKANYVLNPENGQTELGRFGWKANTSTLKVQIATAYHEDMGITNTLFTTDNPSDGMNDDPEITSQILRDVEVYCQTLAVPAPRNIVDAEVRKGAALFDDLKCASCHVPKQRTANAPIAALANQTFWPYTDMLLHDMGEGLADNRADFLADGREWKTRPLWGIGLTQVVNGHTNFLHDGRARNLTEAILWHGGEASASKEMFKSLSTADRENLLKFLNSL